jgi:hypothetical protein
MTDSIFRDTGVLSTLCARVEDKKCCTSPTLLLRLTHLFEHKLRSVSQSELTSLCGMILGGRLCSHLGHSAHRSGGRMQNMDFVVFEKYEMFPTWWERGWWRGLFCRPCTRPKWKGTEKITSIFRFGYVAENGRLHRVWEQFHWLTEKQTRFLYRGRKVESMQCRAARKRQKAYFGNTNRCEETPRIKTIKPAYILLLSPALKKLWLAASRCHYKITEAQKTRIQFNYFW